MNRLFCYEIDPEVAWAHSGNGPYFVPNDCGSVKNGGDGFSFTLKWDNGDEVILRQGEKSLLPGGSSSFQVIHHVAAEGTK